MSANIKSSSEFQNIVLSTIIKDTYLLTRTVKYIDDTFFDKYSYKLIFQSIKYYYDKYGKLASLNELKMIIGDFHKPEYGDLTAIKGECQALYDTPRYDESFVMDKLTTFIKRNNVEKILKEFLPKVQSGSEIAIESIGEELQKGLNFQITKSNAFKLSDTKDLAEVRKNAVGSEENPLIIKSFVEGINQSLQFKGYKPGDVVMIVAAPGVGKTMFMINEGSSAAKQGFKVLHLFLGDMKEYDGFVRYTAEYTGKLQDDIVAMSSEEQAQLVQQYNYQGYFSNIVVSAYAASEINIDEMMQEVYRLQDENHCHFDMICVDYADNLQAESTMMYESGGAIYNKLSLLGSTNKSVIVVGSQPKTEYWDDEIIPKRGAAESSKKQHVIDVMVTMGKVCKGATIGSLFLAKVRRGSEGKIMRFKTYFERAHLEIIGETEYLQEKSNL